MFKTLRFQVPWLLLLVSLAWLQRMSVIQLVPCPCCLAFLPDGIASCKGLWSRSDSALPETL